MPVVRPAGRMGQLGLVLPIAPPGNFPAQVGSTTHRTRGITPGDTPVGGPGLARALAARCAAAEDAGATGLWAVDHLFWGTPMLECLSTLAVAATATTRAILGSCVLQLPLRRAAVVAKQAATLQLLSGGRLVVGVGVGSHPDEYRLAGADFARRGRDLDRGLAALRRCWTG
ncbi:MAG: LLM class flavin-dependent oxidoreductase, partial [Acidimicrobiales bacterium]